MMPNPEPRTPNPFVIALAQLNPIVGDIRGNLEKIRAARKIANAQGAHLIVTSELFLTGYPPEDLVLKTSFQNSVHAVVQDLARDTADGGAAILIGAPWVEDDKLYNAALLLDGGAIVARTFKHDLPNYGPFDEKRVFMAGELPQPMNFRGTRLGVPICEDIWKSHVTAHLAEQGAQILIVPNGSPFEIGKHDVRRKLARARVAETGLPFLYLNQLGGQDELIFDGDSFVLDAKGECIAQAKAWEEDILFTHWKLTSNAFISEKNRIETVPQNEAAMYQALMLGLCDYVNKNGFPGIVLGLSGGIDSALVAALAADALGADKLHAVMMPSPYTAQESLDDAAALVQSIGCRYDIIPIQTAMKTFTETLAPIFAGRAADTTEENIQSRIRGLILMALSNKFGSMVVATGNKSEMSVGYATLYGDMCGGFAVLKDVYKTQVYKLTRWRNAHKPVGSLAPDGVTIPENILTRAPTAELKPNQTDQDSLPPYEILDGILECLIERDLGRQMTIAEGYDAAVVQRVWSMLDRAEYKRRQAPPGVKITRRSLGKDRRYPITNGYREG
jgi:NAD+ synthase